MWNWFIHHVDWQAELLPPPTATSDTPTVFLTSQEETLMDPSAASAPIMAKWPVHRLWRSQCVARRMNLSQGFKLRARCGCDMSYDDKRVQNLVSVVIFLVQNTLYTWQLVFFIFFIYIQFTTHSSNQVVCRPTCPCAFGGQQESTKNKPPHDDKWIY